MAVAFPMAVTLGVNVTAVTCVSGLRGSAVTRGEGRGRYPGLKRRIVPPSRYHQPRRTAVGRPEQLETLEAVLIINSAGPSGEPAGQLIPAIRRHGDRVDLDNRHRLTLRRP
jgi:hypothetical protein